MKRKTTIPIFLAALVLQLGCGEKRTDSSQMEGKAIPVQAIVLQYELIPASVEAPGTVQARDRIALSSQINGFVRRIHVRVGDLVKQNQVLATLDARDADSQKALAQAGVEEAQAALQEARKAQQAATERRDAAKAAADLAGQTFNRFQKLYESKSVSPQEMDEARMRRDAGAAELASATTMVSAAQERIKQVEARIAQAKAQDGRADVLVSWTQITAPAAGRIVERPVDPGTAIFPGTLLIVIDSTTSPQVLAAIPAEQAHLLKPGATVRLKSADGSGRVEGRVSEIVPQSDPYTHSVQFKVDLPAGSAMQNGQFVKVEVPEGSRNAMIVPRRAVRESGQLTGLFVAESDSKARFRLVKITPYDADRYEVLSGIAPGEKILASLSAEIIDGISVEIKP
jgi:multidrug efflux pump subunit AcrA (membrane-fusion protein)